MINYGTPVYGTTAQTFQIDDTIHNYYYRQLCSIRPISIEDPDGGNWTNSNQKDELFSKNNIFATDPDGINCQIGFTGYTYVLFEFQITPNSGNITWKGYSNYGSGEFFIWSESTGSYDTLWSLDSTNTEHSIDLTTTQITNGIKNGKLYFAIKIERIGQTYLYSDYIKLTINGDLQYGTPVYGTPEY